MEEVSLENLTEAQKNAVHELQKRVDGASMLSKEISLLKAGVAHDMMLIRTGEQGENYEHLKYVCFDKLSPKFNMVQVLMKNITAIEDGVQKPGRPFKEKAEKETLPIAGELDGPTIVEPEVEPVKTVNMFEKISREVLSVGQGR